MNTVEVYSSSIIHTSGLGSYFGCEQYGVAKMTELLCKEKRGESRKWRHKSALLYFVWESSVVEFSSTTQSSSSSGDFQTFSPCFCKALCTSKGVESWLCVVSTLRSPCVARCAALFLEQHHQETKVEKKPFLWKSQIMPLSEVSHICSLRSLEWWKASRNYCLTIKLILNEWIVPSERGLKWVFFISEIVDS